MRRAVVIYLLGAWATLPAAAMSLEDVRELLRAGVDEETIRAQIRSEGATYRLEAADILALHAAGASGDFLQYLIRIKSSSEVPEGPVNDSDQDVGGLPASRAGSRFFMQARKDGHLVYVFTNLDSEGNRLPEEGQEPSFSRIASPGFADRPSPPPEGPSTEIPDFSFPPGPSTQVIVVQSPPPPPAQPVSTPLYGRYPVFFTGGIAGPFRYPDRLPFLGYGFDNDFPRFFTGLGMKARTKDPEKDN